MGIGVGSDEFYKVTIYVENKDIAAYLSTDYGIMEGVVTKISKDIRKRIY